MNNTLVNNINSKVGQDDTLIMLGDVAFGGYENVRLFMDRIICDEVHLVLGNHDKHIKVNRDGLKSLFTSVSTRLEVEIDEDMFVMDHYPIREWEGCHKGWYMLYGHTHPQPNDRFLNGYRSMNVGFDGHPEFRPYHIKEILKLLKDKPIHGHH
jgi:calcineurin-like phosphoesterase family protein